MKRTDLAYVAGIIDGEGCIFISRRFRSSVGCDYQLSVSVASTDQWLIEYLRFGFGGSIGFRPPKDNWMASWTWRVKALQAHEFLQAIRPYLKLKGPQADLAILFQSQRSYHGNKGRTESERAVEEAQFILLKTFKRNHKIRLPKTLPPPSEPKPVMLKTE